MLDPYNTCYTMLLMLGLKKMSEGAKNRNLEESAHQLFMTVQVQETVFTGGKPRNYQAISGTCRGSCKAENWINKGWCHFHFC